MAVKPFCFVLMPFGDKKDDTGHVIHFDTVYSKIIQPAIAAAGMEAIRADEELIGGIIHKPMFERLMLCDYAVADLTTANANVLYELGIRHGIRPSSTVLVFAKGHRLPFDVSPLRGLPYSLGRRGSPSDAEKDRDDLTARLESAKAREEDSPLFQLVSDWPRPEHLARLKTDKFRELVAYAGGVKDALAKARSSGVAELKSVEATLNFREDDPALLVDLLLSYRAVKGWSEMIDLVGRLEEPLKSTVLIQEQLGLALNRAGQSSKAEAVLKAVVKQHGPSSETLGILGRVYKDLWREAREQGDGVSARTYLRRAQSTYLQGFQSDLRDIYPGINAVTLLFADDQIDAEFEQLLPVVKYAAARRLESDDADYWDYATMLELHCLSGNQRLAEDSLGEALVRIREVWEPESTAGNLKLIQQASEARGSELPWLNSLIDRLENWKPKVG